MSIEEVKPDPDSKIKAETIASRDALPRSPSSHEDETKAKQESEEKKAEQRGRDAARLKEVRGELGIGEPEAG